MMTATMRSSAHNQRLFPPPFIGGRAWREGMFLASFSHTSCASGSGGKLGFDIVFYGLRSRAVIALEPTA